MHFINIQIPHYQRFFLNTNYYLLTYFYYKYTIKDIYRQSVFFFTKITKQGVINNIVKLDT